MEGLVDRSRAQRTREEVVDEHVLQIALRVVLL